MSTATTGLTTTKAPFIEQILELAKVGGMNRRHDAWSEED